MRYKHLFILLLAAPLLAGCHSLINYGDEIKDVDPAPSYMGTYIGPLIYYRDGERNAFKDTRVELEFVDRDQTSDIGLTAYLTIHDFPLDIEGKETTKAGIGLLWDGYKFKELPKTLPGYFVFMYGSINGHWTVKKAHGLLQEWKDSDGHQYKRLLLDTVVLEDCPFSFDFSGNLDPDYQWSIVQE